MGETVDRIASTEPRWPAALAILTLLLLVLNLHTQVRLFPQWFPYAAVALMLGPIALVAVSHGHPVWIRVERALIFAVTAVIGVIGLATLIVVIRAMLVPSGVVSGLALLGSSVALWVANIVCASLFYWQLDRGGPWRRTHRAGVAPDWRFPGDEQDEEATQPWSPAYADYLFLAFTTATAFSPTDTVPLTARAKMLMMLQALLSLATMVIVAARAVGELGP